MAGVDNQTIQQSLLEATDYLIKERVSELQLDKTIICSIIGCTNSMTGEYKVQYQDGFFTAYAQNLDISYALDELVYVLVPLGDFTNTKLITGKATTTSNKELLTLLDIEKYKYKKTSGNCLSNGAVSFPQGLNSYKAHDGKYLYYKIEQYENSNTELVNLIGSIPQMNFDENGFRASLEQSNFIWLGATFRTALSYAHKLTQFGKYGYSVTLAFKKDGAKIQQQETSSGLIEYYNQEDIIYRSFTIDSDQMIGNPFRFEIPSNQYMIYPIDPTNYLYLKSVEIYSKDFESTSVVGIDDDDIFISNLELFSANPASISDNNYNLIISPLDGTNFSYSGQSLRFQATVLYKQNTDISDETQTSYNWFLRDDRINSSSEYYSYLAGAKWKKLDTTTKKITLYDSQCLAYENEYKLIVTIANTTTDNSPQVVLSETFKVYNLMRKYPVTLESNRGLKFDYTNGTITIKCLIDGHDGVDNSFINNYNNNDFSFWWSRTIYSPNGETAVTYVKTKEQLETEYQNAVDAEYQARISSQIVDTSLSQSLKREIEAYNDTTINKNFFTTSLVSTTGDVEIGCTVTQKINNIDYYLGAASLRLTNGEDVQERGYTIEIINGNQLFQYNEDGISPTSSRFQEPQIINPLSVLFYSPEGELINLADYDYKWIVPVTNTLFDFEGYNLENFAGNEGYKYYQEDILPLKIKDYYDVSATNNQITVQLTYQDQVFSNSTTFTFLKIGENGSNGTSYAGKIVSRRETLDDSLLSIETTINDGGNEVASWNVTGRPALSENILMLQFEKYYEGRLADIKNTDNISWGLLGKSYSRFLSVNPQNGLCTFIDSADNRKNQINQIVKATLSYKDEDITRELYAFLGIPIIRYLNRENGEYTIWFDKHKTLQTVIYGSDGENPLYNKNQGFSFNWKNMGIGTKYLAIEPQGGINNNSETANFELLINKNDKPKAALSEGSWKKQHSEWTTYPRIVTPISEEIDSFMCYIAPKDNYNGEWFNNAIHGRIYSNESDAKDIWNIIPNNTCEVEFWIPINFLLNTYGLRSLNGWDGTHIDINEDDGYILAPQIGAGKKEEDNTFTGIVMGVEKHYEQPKEEDVGLMGYSFGRRSIFLDAKTGKAEFGLPEDVATANNNYQNGKIILNPNGESSIGNWTIGSHSLFNITNSKGKHSIQTGKPYRDSFAEGHIEDINSTDCGILISAEPAYISIKGSKNTVSGQGSKDKGKAESLELQLDPNQKSIFSIFSHYKDGDTWKRQLKVGIDAQGRFFANSLLNNYNNLNISDVDAFGVEDGYIGIVDEVNLSSDNFAESNVTVFKAFIDKVQSGSRQATDSTLYITGGNLQNEYARPVSLHGKEIRLFANGANTVNDPRRACKFAEDGLLLKINSLELVHKNFVTDKEGNILFDSRTGLPAYEQIREDWNELNDVVRGLVISKKGNTSLVAEEQFVLLSKSLVYKTNQISPSLMNHNLLLDGSFTGEIGKTSRATNNKIRVLNGDWTSEIDLNYNLQVNSKATQMVVGYKTGSNAANAFSVISSKVSGNGTNTVEFYLNHGKKSALKVGHGLDISSQINGINIISANSAQGIIMTAKAGTDDSTLKLIPQDRGSGGSFALNSYSGQLYSTSQSLDLSNKAKHLSVVASPGLVTPWTIINSTIPNTEDHSIEMIGSAWGADYKFISDPIRASSKTNSLIGAHLDNNNNIVFDMTAAQSKSVAEQFNAIYMWSAIVYSWYKEFLDLKQGFNEFLNKYATDLADINQRLSTMGSDMAEVANKLGSTIDPQERYGTLSEEVQTQHKVISSKEFYATDFVRDDDTIYFIVDS